MSIANFKDFLDQTYVQVQPQRLMFLFAKATEMDQSVKVDHQSGTITPVMCVDKLPEELESFEMLVKEADTMSKEWDFIFISTLSGKDGNPPTSQDADPFLEKMSNQLLDGGDFSGYIILDRMERPVIIS
jgi:hypothetical protein